MFRSLSFFNFRVESMVLILPIASSSYIVRTFHAMALYSRSGFLARRIRVGELVSGRAESYWNEDTRELPYDRRC